MAEAARRSVVTRSGVRALDRWTIEHRVPALELMERAGRCIADAVVDAAGELAPRATGGCPRVLVLAGRGNNGGDGFVVARLLAERGWTCTVALCQGEPSAASDAGDNLVRWRRGKGSVVGRSDALAALRAPSQHFDVVIDALFGTGLDRPLAADAIEIVRALDDSGLPAVAVDIPSGLCADSGKELGAAVRAAMTVTVGCAKPGLFVGNGPNFVGRVVVADIGLVAPAEAGVDVVGELLDLESVAPLLPQRAATSHKGQTGHVLLCGSSPGKSGAVLLAARGALRSGAGLVTMAVPAALASAVDAALWEAMTLALPADGSGETGLDAWSAIAPTAAQFAAAAVGPGLGTGEGATELVTAFIERFPGRLVLDADALNLLARNPEAADRLRHRGAQRDRGGVILTPHPGEMARLLGTSSADVQADRIAAVRACAARFPGTAVVLKGAATLVAADKRLRFNTSGNPGMASPGMGDVLSGVAAALFAVLSDPLDTAAAAVFLHGFAADLLAAEVDGPGFFASEVADALPDAFASTRQALVPPSS